MKQWHTEDVLSKKLSRVVPTGCPQQHMLGISVKRCTCIYINVICEGTSNKAKTVIPGPTMDRATELEASSSPA